MYQKVNFENWLKNEKQQKPFCYTPHDITEKFQWNDVMSLSDSSKKGKS